MSKYDNEPLDAATVKCLKAYKIKKALEQKELEERFKEFEKEAARYNLHSEDDDLYLSKKLNDDEVGEPTSDLINKDISSLEISKLLGMYEDVYEKTINLPMDRIGYLKFIQCKQTFKELLNKQEKLLETVSASRTQTDKLDTLFDKISNILDDDELEQKLTKFKDSVETLSSTYYDPYTSCITITQKKELEPTNYDPYIEPIIVKKEVPEQWNREKLLDEYYCEKLLKEAEWVKVKKLTKQLEDMKKQLEDHNKYKMFYIKNNGTDTGETTTKDKLKLFISSNYEITTNHKDRIKTSILHKEYSTIAQMDIKIFISKCKDLGMEVIKASGYNVFTCIKAKEAI